MSDQPPTLDPGQTYPSHPSPETGAPVVDALLGTVLGDRYHLLSRLGVGGMGTVYLARHSLIGRQVAVKVLHPLLGSDPVCVARFLNEGRAAGTLGHPHIVESLDMGSVPGVGPYLVLEYLEGRSLEVECTAPLPCARVAEIGAQVASAMVAAHAAGIIHRDLKAANVFLLKRGAGDHAKVLDFGISRFNGGERRTQSGQIIGTPHCMAPEQIHSPDTIDHRADIYSLGVMLYLMLVGKVPFDETHFPLVLTRILNEKPAAVGSLRQDVPPELAALVDGMLAKDPASRPQSMAEVEEALRRHAQADRLPVELVRRGSGSRVAGGMALGFGGVLVALAALWQQPQQGATAPLPPPVETSVVVVRPAEPVASPALPREPPAILPVVLAVEANVPGAVLEFRGKSFPLPYRGESTRGSEAEVVEVTARAFRGKRFRVLLDQDRSLKVTLSPGRGVEEASMPATFAAPGNASAEPQVAPPAPVRTAWRPTASGRPGSAAVAATPARSETQVARAGKSVQAPAGVAPPLEAQAAQLPPPPALLPEPLPSRQEVPRPGTMDRILTRQAIQGHAEELHACLDRARMENPALSGQLSLRFQVEGSGTVREAVIASSTVGNSRFEACLVEKAGSWILPAPAGGVSTTFEYPLVFR